MSKRHWSSNSALRVGVAGFLTGLIFFSLPKNQLQRTDQTESRYGGSQQHADYALRGVDEAGVPIVARQQTPPTDPKPNRNEWRQEQDLEAQWNQAKWAKYAAFAGFLSALVTAVGIWYVRQTLEANRAMLKAASDQAKAALAAVAIQRLENRAWLRIEDVQPEGGDDALIIIDSGAATLRLVIKVRNIGRTIASRVRVLARPEISVGSAEHLDEAIARVRERTKTRGHGRLIIFPDEAVELKEEFAIKRSDIDKAIATRGEDVRTSPIFVIVNIAYAIEGGDARHETGFPYLVRGAFVKKGVALGMKPLRIERWAQFSGWAT